MTQLNQATTIFSFFDNNVRVIMINNEPWFVAKDVAEVLGYANTAKAISSHCKGVGETSIPTNGGMQTMKGNYQHPWKY